MGTTSSARVIQDVYLAMKSLEIVYRANGAAFEGLADRNEQRQKFVGEGKSISWRGASTNGNKSEYELTKKMLFHCDILKLCLNKNTI